MNTLIIGWGEIGKSIFNVFNEHYKCDIIDKDSDDSKINPEIIHICFPYSDKFVDYVKEYQKKYKPKYTVIHSTVPIGTSKKCDAVHSPVVGLHPFLEESLKTFTKFLGGENASEVADYFRRANIKIYITDKSESTELMKMQSTTFYGLMIEFFKDMKKQCLKYDVPFELFTLWNMNYNEGYEKLGHPEYKKPLLVPIMKKIAGHCVKPNLELIDTPFTKFMKELKD